MNTEPLIPSHGGYRRMRSFQVAQLTYDVTVRFCDKYIDRFSRTKDQMVQAARSGVQNIAEGSEAAGTSKKMELKLTQVARASLEELKLDYEDFLRQNRHVRWDRNHPLRQRLVDARLKTADEVAQWVKAEAFMILEREQSKPSERSGRRKNHRMSAAGSTGFTGSTSFTSNPSLRPALATLYPELSANAALTLATVAGYLLDRHIQALAKAFVDEGGFTERMYRVRTRERSRRR